jgi:O-acetyl-ADP-ribose deacetylase
MKYNHIVLLYSLALTFSTLSSIEPDTELKIGKTRISIIEGDITKQKVDAIVNAANEQLNHAGGVAYAISKAAGPQLQTYCDIIPRDNNDNVCEMGQAVTTPAFNLSKIGIKKIIHAVGPRGITPNKEKLLYDVYYNSLELAREYELKIIAFPAISTAIFGYDIHEATPIAFKAIRDFVIENPNILDEVKFVVYSAKDYETYKEFLYIF